MSAVALKATIAIEEAAEVDAPEEGADTPPKRPEGRPCTPELKDLLRLLGVKLAYDPDGKEGTLEFDPFAQYAIG